jgi:type I restriction enzyme M protein
MPIKKSELYSSLWASCDELRGGMDASRYKDYVLVMLFIKYISDKYANDTNALINIPKGASFKDMVAIKGNSDIGNLMNKIIGKIAVNNDLNEVIGIADFNDDELLGKGKEKVDRLSNLVAIFENPSLDFSKNKAEGDDILGDAYEYLMKHFAVDSGKSKGQFYTPSEVSRVMAKVLGIKDAKNNTTFYDPTCGSASLLLKAWDEANGKGTIYGQEKDVATAALARMNLFLHGNNTHEIHKGQSTLSNPMHFDKHSDIKKFSYIVANPPFSLKNWTNGFNPNDDIYNRFEYGIPPDKNGDYAFLLHILKSLNSTGKAACILPHGVLFRGNAEAEIRKNLIQRGYIKGIIGLPANLFYGTGIPACIIVLDKEEATNRKAIFMIDASKGFMKDGNKNRLREQDIHKIVDVFTKQITIEKYSRLVKITEIADAKNDYNLNIPRYIDSQEAEDLQNIEAHLLGGIPDADIDALNEYWQVYPTLRKELFAKAKRKGYSEIKCKPSHIQLTIFGHQEFANYAIEINKLLEGWITKTTTYLNKLSTGCKPKQVIKTISEDILKTFENKKLIENYNVYQHVMDYWAETMQDDCYLISADGWKAEPCRIVQENKTGKKIDKGWACDLVPADLILNRYFKKEKQAIEELEAQKENYANKLQELEEEHNTEEGYFADYEKINKANIVKRLAILTQPKGKKSRSKEQDYSMVAEPHAEYGEVAILKEYLYLTEMQNQAANTIKEQLAELDEKVLGTYKKLGEADIKQLVVKDKWMAKITLSIQTEMDTISQNLAQRIKELATRYETPLPKLTTDLMKLEEKVNAHLFKMGFEWE